MKPLMFAAAIIFLVSSTASATPRQEAGLQPFEFASAENLKSISVSSVVEATTEISEFCWITYSTCMLQCGFTDPAQFPVDACSEACFNEYMSCAGF
jgi:hypothetical protein